MSRDPLSVLREVSSFMGTAFPTFSTGEEMREAIAQIEALVTGATIAQEIMHASGTGCIALDGALRPFTPGQDSEDSQC